jgi:hypothetical protein
MRFLIPGVASAVAGIALAIAVVFVGTNLAQQDTRPAVNEAGDAQNAIAGQPEYGQRR